ncbi:MAG TPA: class I SAM-dependent methyltransferase [Candidatus Nanoarchaeia archaeon]
MNDSRLELENRIKKIDTVFDLNSIISRKVNTTTITSYYNRNKLAYWLFHSRVGFVHMGISRGTEYNQNDLLEQPKIVAKYIRRLTTRNVLELGTGKGSSSFYLAKRFPKVRFDGVDLPKGQLDVAKKAAEEIPNFHPAECDFHDLSRYSDNQFDVVFAIESLCHSSRKGKVFKEVRRVLKLGGVFIVIDGYLGRPVESLTYDERLAKRLTERGMMVGGFEYYGDVLIKIKHAGFTIIEEGDVTRFIIPTLRRFENLASKTLFDHPKLGHLIVKFLPDEFSANAVAAYLMPLLVDLGVAKYIILVVRK